MFPRELIEMFSQNIRGYKQKERYAYPIQHKLCSQESRAGAADDRTTNTLVAAEYGLAFGRRQFNFARNQRESVTCLHTFLVREGKEWPPLSRQFTR